MFYKLYKKNKPLPTGYRRQDRSKQSFQKIEIDNMLRQYILSALSIERIPLATSSLKLAMIRQERVGIWFRQKSAISS